MEDALRRRNDPAINLALAKFGRHASVVRSLFQAGDPSSAVRLAALSNTGLSAGSIGGDLLSTFPAELFADYGQKGRLDDWLCEAPSSELLALFVNPKLSNKFLIWLLRGEGSFNRIPSERMALLVWLLAGNERMRTPWRKDRNRHRYEHDELLEDDYEQVFDAAWELSQSAPVNLSWCDALANLYKHLPRGRSFAGYAEAAKRWALGQDDRELLEDEARTGFLRRCEPVRTELMKRALSGNPKLLKDMLSSEDKALRFAAYAAGDMSEDEMEAGSERDGKIFSSFAMDNEINWRTSAKRQILHRTASPPLWTIGGWDTFYRTEDDVKKRHPEWFDSEAEKPQEDPSKTNAISGEVRALATAVEQLSQQMREETSSLWMLGAGIWIILIVWALIDFVLRH
jgi:hypothetical protein